jgi:hypothetical protein
VANALHTAGASVRTTDNFGITLRARQLWG